MRWDRLFDDLEAQAVDLERDERDALVDELRDADWADTSWRDLVGGDVALEVLGGGRIEGRAVLVNDRFVQLSGARAEHVVASTAVVAVLSAERRADPPGRVGSALGWGHVFRALRDDGEPVTIRLVDGTTREGRIEVVGADFVRVSSDGGRTQDLVWAAVAVVSGRT